MSHYTEDELTAYVINPTSLPNLAEMEAHIADCAVCGDMVNRMEETEGDLRQPEVWQQVDAFLARPKGLDKALEFKRRMDEEDRAAKLLLEMPLSSPGRFAEARVGERVRYRTGGVLRALCKAAHKHHDKNPQFSLKLAEAACAIGEVLTTDPSTTRYWHGVALRERANAHRYLGEFADALKDLDAAEKMFDRSPGADPFDLAIVGYIRGTVLVQIEREEEALQLARKTSRVFRQYGDGGRELDSLLLEGVCLDTLRKFADAAAVAERVITLARALRDPRARAHGLQNGAIANVQLGQLEHAEKYYAEALALFDELGVEIECARVEWAMAGIVTARGDLENADPMLDHVRSQLLQLGLRNDHAMATLEWVEIRLALNRIDSVIQACKEILMEFGSEGIARNARMALAYLQQALAMERATPHLVREVRNYLRQLPRHPDAPFVPTSQ